MDRNKYKMPKIIKFIFLSIYITFIFAQSVEAFMQKTTLENSLRDKIYSELGHVIDNSKFVVVVNVAFDNDSNLLGTGTKAIQSSNNKLTDLSVKAPSGNSMDFIPGFKLSGAKTRSQPNEYGNLAYSATGGSNQFGAMGSLQIKKINVNFYLEESLSSPKLDRTIETLVKSIIPMISDCDDCISIETMQFQESSEESEIVELREKIEQFEADKRNEELTDLKDQLTNLGLQLTDLETDNDSYLREFKLDKAFQRTQDSLRLVTLEEKENAARDQLDTLLLKAQQKIDTVINARIASETETKKDLIDIIKYGQGNLSEEEDNQGLLGMRGPRPSDNNLLYLGFGAMIFLMFIVLFFKKNKQDVVYLKPKGSAKKGDKKKNKVSEGDETETSDLSEAQVTQAPLKPYATNAFEDENVLRAELKALRQSAVSMSVSQQEGATQIVKDWLSDNAGETETDGEEG